MPEQTFEQYVDSWDALCGQIAELKRKLAPLQAAEMKHRLAIRDAVKQALGTDWKEGTNTWIMADERVLKVVQNIERKIEDGEIEAVRGEYEKLNDRTVVFDSLLRIKRELVKDEFKKLEGEAARLVSRMITSKESAPEVKLT